MQKVTNQNRICYYHVIYLDLKKTNQIRQQKKRSEVRGPRVGVLISQNNFPNSQEAQAYPVLSLLTSVTVSHCGHQMSAQTVSL